MALDVSSQKQGWNVASSKNYAPKLHSYFHKKI